MTSILQVVGYVAGSIFAFCLGGSATVLAYAYLHNRLSGKNWFTPDYSGNKRWVRDDNSSVLPCPAVIFGLWFLAIPAGIVGFVVSGFFKATEKLGDRLSALAETQRKKIGSFRENPR